MHGGSVSDGPAEGSPLYWPEAPWDASYHHDEGWFGWQGDGWTVPRVPPGGFPFVDFPFPRDQYGPPGTVWLFSEADLFASFVGLPTGPTRSAVNFPLRKFGLVLGGSTLMRWRTPDPSIQPPPGDPMRWIHATIIGAIGSDETVAHTLN